MSPLRPELPPAIVLGIDTPIGLTVVRELGEHGVAVHGIARNRRGIGLYSRWLHRGYLRPPDADGMIALLNRIARESGAAFLLTISMNDALAMREAGEAGALPGLRPLIAPRAKLELVNDKLRVCAIAAGLGIPVPATWEPTVAELEAGIPGHLSYPCILKWRDPERDAAPLARHGLKLLKSEHAADADALRQALERYRPAGRFPLVQSFCPGRGLGQMFLMKNGEALLRFQHERLAEWPPDGGTSTVCRSLPPEANAALMAQSEALLRHIGWQGAAMVEYRFDPATGRTALMEINGRFWGSLPLAYHAGVQFAWGTYCALGLERRPETGPYRAGLRCRYMIPEIRRLLTVVLRRRTLNDPRHRGPLREVLSFLADFLRFPTSYYVFSWRDPRPFLADMVLAPMAKLGGIWRRR
jgi:predicted ATP-grasp superfamily ATP-dependent carboligase